MKGFSGFGDGTNRSPVKAADEGLIEAAKMGSDEVAKTTRQMGNNLANMVSKIDASKDKNDENDENNSPVTFKKPFSRGLDMTLNDNLNKAVKGKGPGSPKVLAQKEFLRKNTIKPKATRPLARNVSRGLRALGRFTGVIGGVIAAAPHIIKGSKAVMPGLKKRAKQEFKGKRSIYSSPKI